MLAYAGLSESTNIMGFSVPRTYVLRPFLNICSLTCQNAILSHTNIMNMARTWFNHFKHIFSRTHVHEHAEPLLLYMAWAWPRKVIMSQTFEDNQMSVVTQYHCQHATQTLVEELLRSAIEATLLPKRNLLLPSCSNLTQWTCNIAVTHWRTQLEHALNMEWHMRPPLWGRLSSLFCRSTVTQFEAC